MKFLQTYMPKYRPTGARAFCVDIMQKNWVYFTKF
jgi:hypothetical protein